LASFDLDAQVALNDVDGLVRFDEQVERLRGLLGGDVPEPGGQCATASLSGAPDPLDPAQGEWLILLRVKGVVDGEFDGVRGLGHGNLLGRKQLSRCLVV